MTDNRQQWIDSNGLPDLQLLVELRGGYDKITAADWATFDQAWMLWKTKQATKNFFNKQRNQKIKAAKRKNLG